MACVSHCVRVWIAAGFAVLVAPVGAAARLSDTQGPILFSSLEGPAAIDSWGLTSGLLSQTGPGSESSLRVSTTGRCGSPPGREFVFARWESFGPTNADGTFSDSITPNDTGDCDAQATFGGDGTHAGESSTVSKNTVEP